MREVAIIEAMVIDMNEAQVRTLEQVRQVVAGTQALEFRQAQDDEGRYGENTTDGGNLMGGQIDPCGDERRHSLGSTAKAHER